MKPHIHKQTNNTNVLSSLQNNKKNETSSICIECDASGIENIICGESCNNPCDSDCCDDNQTCCGSDCCDNDKICCEGICCGQGQSCCGGVCCEGNCCDDVCCGSGEICCGGTCCDGECSDNSCCASGLGLDSILATIIP